MKTLRLFLKISFFVLILLLLSPQYLIFANNTLEVPNDELETSDTIVLSTDRFYPGPLEIPVNKLGLSGKQLLAEEDFSELLQLDLNLLTRLYNEMPSSQNGKILDVDLARKIFPPFNDGPTGASEFSVSTHVPSSQFINYLFRMGMQKLPSEKKNPVMLFLAGGGGSGKGTISKLQPNIYKEADLVLDGTLANLEKAKARVRLALDQGFTVIIVYVFRPIDLAVPGIIGRAMETGRGVPLVVAAEDHYDAQKTVVALSKEFPKEVKIIVINNAGGFNDVKMEDDVQGFLSSEAVSYKSKADVIGRAKNAYQEFIKTHELTPELKQILERGM